jgi:hypothetical protein
VDLMVIGSVGLADLSPRVEKLNLVSDEVTRDKLLDARVPERKLPPRNHFVSEVLWANYPPGPQLQSRSVARSK